MTRIWPLYVKPEGVYTRFMGCVNVSKKRQDDGDISLIPPSFKRR